MSNFGMQLPGGQMRRGPVMNIYTGLLACAVVALAAACVAMYLQGSAIGPNGSAFEVHEKGKEIKLQSTP